MLTSKRKFNWRVISIIVSIVLTLCAGLAFFLNRELFDYRSVANKKQNEKLSISKKTVLQRVSIPNGKYSTHKQYQDFEYNIQDNQVAHCQILKDCFDFSKCKNSFKVYIYPVEFDYEAPMSSNYKNILEVIRESQYYTDNPDEACLFILSLDTLDRDKGSDMFIREMDNKLSTLSSWNNGANHLIFTFFTGIWPNYFEHQLFFNYGKAILVKASSSLEISRPYYDISIPLLPKDTFFSTKPSYVANMVNQSVESNDQLFPLRRKYLLAFKGKRYLYGIGSESRNALKLIHNNKDIVLLTTCRHGKNWEKYQDEECFSDNQNYDKYDYDELLYNSTFCLVPRGRRLGSFRFLEALKYGCIPVLLSNGWKLPFSEVLDWAKFSLSVDEKLILRIPSILRDVSDETILTMKQQTIFVWQKYFSSVKNNIFTALEVLKERIYPHRKRHYLIWNSHPGVHHVSSDFSPSLRKYPFYMSTLSDNTADKYTAILVATTPIYKSSASLFQLIKVINKSQKIDQILVIWLPEDEIPNKSKWPRTIVPLRVVHPAKKSMNSRFAIINLIKTDAVFTLDEDVVITVGQLDFAYSVWKSNPSRIVGFTQSNHVPDNNNDIQWKHSSRLSNEFSTISMTSAVFHKYYSHHYNNAAPKAMLDLVERENTCESLAMNFLVSHIIQQPPIKVAHATSFKDGSPTKNRFGKSFTHQEYAESQQRCFKELVKIFSGLPLSHSKLSANPVLYRDVVSISRKKFKTLG